MRGLYPRRQTPHPSRCSLPSHRATLSHEGRGKESASLRWNHALKILRREIRHHGIEHRKSGLGHPQPAVVVNHDGAFVAQDGNAVRIERAA